MQKALAAIKTDSLYTSNSCPACNHESALAQRSQHLAPHTLAQELAQLNPCRPCPIYITHTKPSETQLIVEQVRRFDAITHPGSGEPHDISWLQAGQEFDV